MAEGGGLENRSTERYRGFESLSLRVFDFRIFAFYSEVWTTSLPDQFI